MTDPLPPPGAPVTSIDDAVARMQILSQSLPAADGLACFNRMYLEVTQDVRSHIAQSFFSDPAFVGALDVVFANQYFDAVNALATPPTPIPAAWQPLFAARAQPGIYPIQFALAGMNAHINHDLPMAVVQTCTELGTEPDAGSHHEDYQRVDTLLDAAEQSIRQTFESGGALKADHRAQMVLDLVCNWNINAARDVAWDTAQALWRSRSDPTVESLIMDGLARTVAMVSRCLLVVPDRPTAGASIVDRVFRSIEVLLHG